MTSKTKQKTRRGRVRKQSRVSKKNKQYGGGIHDEFEQLKTRVTVLEAMVGVSPGGVSPGGVIPNSTQKLLPMSEKKSKGLNAPKRPPSAFFLFSKHYRTKNADDIAGKKGSEVAKMAGKAWTEIKETDASKPFYDEAAKLKAGSLKK